MSTPSRTSLRDVAAAAGVSLQTVSNVVGGRGGFTEETRERVLRAVDELGYVPNRAARGLRSSHTRQIGLHLPIEQISVRNSFSVHFLRSTIAAAEAAGQQLVVLTHPIGRGSDRPLLHAGVDGFVLCDVPQGDPRPRALADAGLPFAVMGHLEAGLPRWNVDIDNVAAMHGVVDHLVARGRRRIAYVDYDGDVYWETERLRGTLERLAQHDVTVPGAWQVRVADTDTSRQVTKLLRATDRPDAIICSSDSLALRVHQAIASCGLRPGADVALTGFDGLPLPVDLSPALTSVRVPMERIAAELVQMVLAQVEGASAPEHSRLVPTELEVAGTT